MKISESLLIYVVSVTQLAKVVSGYLAIGPREGFSQSPVLTKPLLLARKSFMYLDADSD